MGNSISTNAGFSLNGPVIYPSSKEKPQQIQSAESSEEASEASLKATRNTGAASPSTEASQATQSQAAKQAESAQSPAAQSRRMAEADIADQLVKLGYPTTSENRHLASQMTQYGVPLSQENFQALLKELKGRPGQENIEASVVSLLKGLAGLGRSVDILAPYFANQVSVDSAANQLIRALSQFQSHLSSPLRGFDAAMLTQLSGIIGSLIDDLKRFQTLLSKVSGQYNGDVLTRSLLAFSQLLNGMEQRWLMQEQAKQAPFHRDLKQLKQSGYDFLNAQLVQSILSQNNQSAYPVQTDQFFYWSLPNPMYQNRDVDVLVRKSPSEPDHLDVKRTRLIVQLETPELGEITVIIDILNDVVWYTVNADKKETKEALLSMRDTLAAQLKAAKFNLRGFATTDQRVDVKALLLPRGNLDDVVRIEVEA